MMTTTTTTAKKAKKKKKKKKKKKMTKKMTATSAKDKWKFTVRMEVYCPDGSLLSVSTQVNVCMHKSLAPKKTFFLMKRI